MQLLRSHSALAALIALLASSPPARAADPGAIRGTVRLGSAPPPRQRLLVTKDPLVCGMEKLSEAIVVGQDLGVKDAVVSLAGAQAAAPAPTRAVLDQQACSYVPHVQAVARGSTLEVRSSDPVLHNVHGYRPDDTTLFNLGMPTAPMALQRTLGTPGLYRFRCEAGHPWMSAFVWVFDQPYFAVTDDSGTFVLGGVPPGDYVLRVWHEGWKPKAGAPAADAEPVAVDRPVHVEAGKTTSVTVVLE